MTKILVLGASGLIGSTIYKYLSSKKNLLVFGTYNQNKPPLKNIIKYDFFDTDTNFINDYDLLINCIGVTKHHNLFSNIDFAYNLNIKLPLILNDLVKSKKIKVIHISTDCIFSGSKGNYKENDIDYSTDIYGQTKRIAESLMKDSLVIRTSTIGHEFFFKKGLLEWFLSINSQCKGFDRAYFNGLTSLELAKIIYKYFIKKSFFPKMLLNIGSNKISKYELLNKLKIIYDLSVKIERDTSFYIDRSLNISKFIKITNYKPKTWYKMLIENKNYIYNVQK
tara:strand:+ start:6022 stop:6861 length:840 start_codon:yes stop_codon:yes gene_type:complete